MLFKIYRGTVGKIAPFFIYNSSTGQPMVGLTAATAGLTCYCKVDGASGSAAVPLVAGTIGMWSSGGFVEVDSVNMKGLYELGVPNADEASGTWVVIYIGGSVPNMQAAPALIELDAVNYQSATAFMTSLATVLNLTNVPAALTSQIGTPAQASALAADLATIMAALAAPAAAVLAASQPNLAASGIAQASVLATILADMTAGLFPLGQIASGSTTSVVNVTGLPTTAGGYTYPGQTLFVYPTLERRVIGSSAYNAGTDTYTFEFPGEAGTLQGPFTAIAVGNNCTVS